MKQKIVKLPHNFTARWYQLPFLHAMEKVKRAVCVWHRRAGKDKTFLNFLIPKMLQRVGAYYYYFPTAAMGRDILWDGMDRDGFKFTDHFPKELIKGTPNQQEMKIELKNGSIFKIRGTDKREPIGVNPVGVVFSEYSRQNPKGGWDLVRPILAENGGWAVFNYTPRGKNHAWRLYTMARSNPKWFCQTLTASETKAISEEAIDDERQSGMSEELVQQEFYCSFDIGAEGSYYGRLMADLWSRDHIKEVVYDITIPVFTFWDLGFTDSTSIWFAQFVQNEIHLIDYYQNQGHDYKFYKKVLQDKPYVYGGHYGPHDLRATTQQTGMTNWAAFKKLGIEFNIVKGHRKLDGINTVRGVLPLCWFDKEKCSHGIDCLENYHKDFDDKKEDFKPAPEHDWSSHGADAFRYLSMQYRWGRIDGKVLGYRLPENTDPRIPDIDEPDLCSLAGLGIELKGGW